MRLLFISKNTRNFFGKTLVFGVGVMFALNLFQHVGMNLSVLPITGVPLPLISDGGSAILTFFIGLGLVNSVYLSNLSDNEKVVKLEF